MWTFLLIQMMPNLYYPYLCNTTLLLCRHMALPHWCPCLGGWTVLPNLACSRRADNGKKPKIRELFFNVLLKYAIWMSPTEYDLRHPVSRGDSFCNFHWHVKSNLYLQWSPFVLHMQKLHHVNQEEMEHILSCKCSVQ